MAARKEVRKRWAKEDFAYVLSEKHFVESYKKVDVSLGKMYTFGALVKELGGWKWKPAIWGAKLHFIKAMRMGGRWIERDDMSNLLMALRLERTHKEVMSNKWTRFTKFHNDKMIAERADDSGDDAPGEIEDDEEPTGAEPTAGARKNKKDKGKLDPKAKAKTKASARGKVTPPKPPNEGGDDGDIDDAISKRKIQEAKDLNKTCQKIKTLLKSCQADAGTLLQAFGSDPAYEWGKGAATGELALKNCMTIELTAFHSEFLMEPIINLHKRYNIDFVISELEGFEAKKESVDTLNALVQKLVRVHAANHAS